MIVLGITGGMAYPNEENDKLILTGEIHDAAAVLLVDGKVVAAVEEERVTRIKNTGKLPVNAIKSCLEYQRINLNDVDKIVFYCEEITAKFELVSSRNRRQIKNYSNPKKALLEMLGKFIDGKMDPENVVFVNHHICHAASAYYMSGFEDSLVLTIDGASPEGVSGTVLSVKDNQFKVLNKISNDDSLGAFYNVVIGFLGYGEHDEYKVMGLAPYGNAKKFRRIFKRAYNLLPEGKIQFNSEFYFVLMECITPRLKDGPFTQEHKDIAAALQETLETIVMHILTYYRAETGHTKLCMAGGVAHNCSMNGKLLYSGLFDDVYVQPAAHDAGNALGGALFVSQKFRPELSIERMKHLYLGSDISSGKDLEELLERWGSFITIRQEKNIEEQVAELIASGSVIGWIQGRSEFGPRALGNRSILADPRPVKNKTIINNMVKKREGYRPFAPSVMEEYIGEYYEIPKTRASFNYMNFVLKTKEDKQSMLGAVTHIDGTARIQTVSKSTNLKYWNLINEFKKITGVPILLNTSFNNNVEPIVDTEEDAIVSFLTTNIDYLVIGNYLIEKKEITNNDFIDMIPKRTINSAMKITKRYSMMGEEQTVHEITLQHGTKYRKVISKEVYQVLQQANGEQKLFEIINNNYGYSQETTEKVLDEILELWSLRLIKLSPVKVASLVY